MEILKNLFPFAFKSKDNNSLIVSIIIYLVIGVVGGAVIGVLAGIPLIGFVFTILGSIVGLYGFLGIVLSLLVFFNVVKD